MNKIYVVAWEHAASSGFTWYWTERHANEAFQAQSQNDNAIAFKPNYEIIKFDFVYLNREYIKDEIDDFIHNNCDRLFPKNTAYEENAL